ncbi:MAG TPA: sugar ABC transporter permease [Spirochaetia bacterium]|nr:sugar ABC transporter permease [Spirochaetia bacterium]
MAKDRNSTVVFWVFLTPVLFAFVMVIIIPFLLGVFYSFTDWSSSAGSGAGLKFVGLANFVQSFTDPAFIYSFIVTFIYTGINVIVLNVVALALALIVTSRLKFRNIYRVGFFVPNLIGGLILGYIWQFIFNNAIPALGGIFANPDNLVLSKSATSVAALVIVGTWQYAGYIMMIYIAAIESVPQELYEAAKIDGAVGFQRFIRITVPMIAQAFTITMFLTLVTSFKQFDVNVSLTAGGPSTMFMGKPIFATQLLALHIYDTAFAANHLAMAQARAVIFFLVLVIISTLQVRANKKREIEA